MNRNEKLFLTPLLFSTGGLFESSAAPVVRTLGGNFRGSRGSLYVDIIRAADEREEGAKRDEGSTTGVDILSPSGIWVAVCFTLVRSVRVVSYFASVIGGLSLFNKTDRYTTDVFQCAKGKTGVVCIAIDPVIYSLYAFLFWTCVANLVGHSSNEYPDPGIHHPHQL